MPVRNHLPRFVAIAWLIATPAAAADQPMPSLWPTPLATKAAPLPDIDYFAPPPFAAWQADFAARYWFASAKTGKSLFGTPGADGMVSRLTYSDLLTNSGEVYGRLAGTNGWFLKGYLGIGTVSNGHLQDEDFPPVATPYSSTTSDQRNGYLDYASVDVGYNFVRGGDFNLGAFVGYHYFNEVVNAFGCMQTAGNPNICQPSIPTPVETISQNNKWQSLRVGLDGSVMLAGRFKLTADAAWLPYVRLDGADSHLLRIGNALGDFTGPIPETGTGMGYQFEALLSYQLTPNADIGVGGRYWHMQASGNSHFEGMVVGENTVAQPVAWKTDIYGVFVQAGYKFGPYPLN
jgi:outer membrane protease